MKPVRKRLIWLLALVLTVLVSCGDGVVDAADEATAVRQVKLTFTLIATGDDSSAGTRADTWADNENATTDHGTLYETKIDPEALQVFVYSATDNTLLGSVQNLVCYRTDTESNRHIYRFMGNVSVVEQALQDGNFDAKIAVLANCPDYAPAAGAALADMAELTFSYSPADYAAAEGEMPKKNIPMWGVTSVSKTLTSDVATDIGTIYMLRALAKIELCLSDKCLANGMSITSATLNHYNASGYVVPKDGLTASATTAISIVDGFNPADKAATNAAFSKTDDTYYMYVPEYANVKGSDTEATISVRLDYQADFDAAYTVHIADYSDSSLPCFDIVRNSRYRFVINKDANGLTVTPTAWTHTFDHEYDFK